MKIDALLEQMVEEGLISAESIPSLSEASVSDSADATRAWYLRFFIGVSAWIAAFLFVAALAVLDLIDDELMLAAVGLVACFSTLALKQWLRSRDADNLFLHQLAMAGSLGGLLMFGVGLNQYFREITPPVFATITLATLLFFFYPDRLHRTLMVTVIIGLFELWCFDVDFDIGYHLLMWLLAAGSAWLWHKEPRQWEGLPSDFALPLSYALPIGLLVSLAWISQPDYFWLSMPGIVLVGCYVALKVLDELMITSLDTVGFMIIFAIVLIGALTASMPGILAALLVLALAYWRGNRVLGGVALVAFVFFISYFFADLAYDNLAKSLILMGSGGVLLLLRLGLVSADAE